MAREVIVYGDWDAGRPRVFNWLCMTGGFVGV